MEGNRGLESDIKLTLVQHNPIKTSIIGQNSSKIKVLESLIT